VRGGVAKSVEQDTIKKAIRMTYDAGIYILANFIFGLPDDNLETMQETLDLAKEFNFEYVNFYAAMAYPGSRLHEDALQQGLKLPEKWHAYTQLGYETLPLPTKYLSGADVLRFRDRAFEEYYRNPEYLASITRKFGNEVVKHIEDMLTHKIRRKYA
jgi:anaerobic magnesium-protoporphyrin IX monomethyl ester cyclase